MKRLLDIVFAFFGLVALLPILIIFMYLVYRQDKASLFYMASRVGRKNMTLV